MASTTRRVSGVVGAALALTFASSAARHADAAACRAGDTGVVNVSNTPNYAEGEEPMASDPTNPCNVTAVANVWQATFPGPLNPFPGGNGAIDSAVYSSNDGGRTWRGGRLDQGGLGTVADPLPSQLGFAPEFSDFLNVITADSDVAWDNHGNAYYESGDLHGLHHNGDVVASVWRSRDGARTWGTGVSAVSAFQEQEELDRPWFAVDNSGGPRDGAVYLAFETGPFTDDPPKVFLKRSDDQGHTWSATTRVDDGTYETQFNPRNRPAVGADGALYVAYDRAPITNTVFNPQQVGAIALVLARSTDGGQTFDRFVADNDIHRITSPDEALPGYAEMISAIATDPTHPGRVALAWPEQVDATNARIMLRTSTDGGATWSPRVDVADDAIGGVPNQHDHVALTWLPDGRLVVMWRDRRCCGGSYDSDFQQWARAMTVAPSGPTPSGRVVEFTNGPQPITTGHHGFLAPDEFQGLSSGPLGVMATWSQLAGSYPDVVYRRIPLDRFAPE